MAFTGGTNMAVRARYIREFQQNSQESTGGARIMVITIRLGSVGITLTAATRVYLLEPAFDPATEVQAAGRIHRLGQTRDVLIKKFAFRNTIEENICTMHEEIRAGRVAITNGNIPPQAITWIGRS